MKRLGILTVQFYKLLLLYNIAFSILASFIFFFDSGSINAGSFLFAKITGFICAIALHYYSAKESYFYFRNAGYSIRLIFFNAFIVDILIYTLLITLADLTLHAAA